MSGSIYLKRDHREFLLLVERGEPPRFAQPGYLPARIHSTNVLRSASGTLFGGIGIAPQTPLPPP
jgi:hypothetical protein